MRCDESSSGTIFLFMGKYSRQIAGFGPVCDAVAQAKRLRFFSRSVPGDAGAYWTAFESKGSLANSSTRWSSSALVLAETKRPVGKTA